MPLELIAKLGICAGGSSAYLLDGTAYTAFNAVLCAGVVSELTGMIPARIKITVQVDEPAQPEGWTRFRIRRDKHSLAYLNEFDSKRPYWGCLYVAAERELEKLSPVAKTGDFFIWLRIEEVRDESDD